MKLSVQQTRIIVKIKKKGQEYRKELSDTGVYVTTLFFF